MSSPDDAPSTLGVLVARHRSGDSSAIHEIIVHCQERARKLASSMLGRFANVPPEVETGDVVNELVVRLLVTLREKTFDSPAQLLTYAALCMRNNLIDLARKRRPVLAGDLGTHSSSPGQIPEQADSTNDPGKLAQWGEIHALIDQLPEDERVLFDLLFYQDLTVAEASEILGIPYTTLRVRWLNARVGFMKRLGNNPPF